MTNFPALWGHACETGVCPCARKLYLQQCSSALLILKPSMAFKIPLLDSLSLTKGYFHDIPNFRLGRCHRQGRNREGKFRVRDEGKLHSREENRGGKAIFRRERLKSEDRSKGGEDVAKSRVS